MCVDPVTAGIIGAVGSVASIGLNLAGTSAQAAAAQQKAQAEAEAYRMKALEYQAEADIKNRQANIEQMTSQYQQRRKVEQGEQLGAAQRNALAGQGIMVDSGSAADIQLDTTREAALDVAAIQWGSTLKAQNLQTEARVSSMNRDNAMMASSTALRAGQVQARAIGLSGLSDAASSITRLGMRF